MMNIFVNTTTTAFLNTTIPYKARKHGNVFAARLCYAHAVILFLEDKISDLDVTRLLDKALELNPNFLDADNFRQEIWHKILTPSRRWNYSDYLSSPAWSAKKAQALERDGHRCALCNAGTALEVHHKTYDNIGKEPLNDLTTLCATCHNECHIQLESFPETAEEHDDTAQESPYLSDFHPFGG